MNRNRVKRVAAVATATVVAVSGVGYYAYNYPDTKAVAADKAEIEKTLEDKLDKVINTSDNEDCDKEETVYVIADAEGEVQKKIVSDRLRNKTGAATIEDKTDLHDVVNVKGDEDYIEGTDGNITWNANGADIYYQGTTDKELPVDVRVKYYLNGEEMKPEDMAGKSGEVKIRFEYTNNSKKDVSINGKNTQMYVPFTMISGMMLPTENFTNVKISDGNGKLIEQGKSTVVVGVSFPGLSDNLELASMSDKVNSKISDVFEITADVEDFSIAMTLTAGTADVFSVLDPESFDSLDDVSDTVDELVDAVGQLKDGSVSLKSGIGELRNGAAKVNDGVGILNSKTGEFADGLKKLDDGVALMLSKMNAGDGAIAGAQSLAAGTSTVDSKLKEVQDGVSGLSDGADKIDGAAGDIADGVDKLNTGAGNLYDGIGKLQKGADELADSTDKINGYVGDARDGADKLNGYLKKLNKAIASASSGSSKLLKGMQTVSAAISDFDGKGTSMIDVFKQLSAGAASVSDGVGKVADGVDKLEAGANATQNGIEQVGAGAKQLEAGVDALQNSMVSQLQTQIQANTENIEKLTMALNTPDMDAATAATYKQNIAALKGANEALQGVIVSLTTSSGDASNPSAADGFAGIKNGASAITSQLTETQDAEGNATVYGGAVAVASGAGELNSNMSALDSGAALVADSLDSINKGLPNLVDGISTIETNMGTLKDGLSQMKTSSASIVDGSGDLASSLGKLQDEGTEPLNTAVQSMATDKKNGVPALKNGAGQIKDGLNTLNGNMGDFTDGTSSLAAGLNTLDSQLPALKDGTSTIATGMSSLLVGLTTLSDTVGTEMKPGLDTLYSGGLTLRDSVATLYSATGQIASGLVSADEGSGKLVDGIAQLKEEAVDPVSDTLDDDFDNGVERIKKTIEVADDYGIYSAAAEGKEVSVKFIYKTGGIEK